MDIGIVMKHVDKAKVLKEGLIASGCKVTIYTTAQEALNAILGAKFNNRPLPHKLLLLDLDLGEGINGPELVRRIRQYANKSELTFILMNGRSVHEESLVSDNLLDVRVVYNDASVIVKAAHRAAIVGIGGN
jgi:CheY-like chemotaxis protein